MATAKGGEDRITRRLIFGEIAGRGATAGLGDGRLPLRGADGEQRQHRVRAAEDRVKVLLGELREALNQDG